jgi:hypothetical protein
MLQAGLVEVVGAERPAKPKAEPARGPMRQPDQERSARAAPVSPQKPIAPAAKRSVVRRLINRIRNL